MGKNRLYPYAVARIRMLERTLLTEKQYTQMTEARSIEDALKILSEAGFGEEAVISPKVYEEALSKHLAKAYADVAELMNGERFIDVFLLKNDYHNLKVLMKSEITKSEPDKYLVGGGTVSLVDMKTAFETKSMELIPVNMQEAVEKANEAYGKTLNGQMIDIVLDKAAFSDMKTMADKSGNTFVKGYMEILCDLTNMKSFLRIKNMKKPFDTLTHVFVEGGTLSMDVFKQGFTAENPSAAFKETQYSNLGDAMLHGITYFEKMCDDYIMGYMRDAKYKSLTLEPMVAYIYARETEIKTIRIILNSKINKIAPEVIKERLRDAYV